MKHRAGIDLGTTGSPPEAACIPANVPLFLMRLGRVEDAHLLWKELGSRQGYAAQHHRDELTTLLGSPGEGALSDIELVELIRRLLHELESEVAPSGDSVRTARPVAGTQEVP